MENKPLIKLDTKAVSPKAKKMYDFLKNEIRGQDRALKYVVNACERFYSPFRDVNKPIFVCLELGPSGVGKTLLAEALAKYLFGNPTGFTKINCAEYSQPHEVARLKGAPPGYIGYVDSEKDPGGSQCILGQFNIDKYHLEALSRKHKEEVDKLYERGSEIFAKETELEETLKRIKELREKSTALQKKSKSLPRGKELSAIKTELKAIFNEYKKLEREYIKEKTANRNAISAFEKEMAEAEKKGWVYNPNNPSKRLISIILFDELEKADEDLFEHLLEIMDKGRFQLGNGLTTSFRNSFVLMTSNVGREEIAKLLRDSDLLFKKPNKKVQDLDEEIYGVCTEEAKRIFPTEFLGRVDKIIVFRPLTTKVMLEILDLKMQELHTELIRRGCPILISLDQSVKDYIVERAIKYQELGARLLKSRITDYVKDRLISLLNTQQLAAGDKITVKLEKIDEKEELIFYKEEKEKSEK